ncbi:MAG: ribonuclease D [Verrucomicrobiales bacterium]|nr:ribonuclease D [Verrucomicrobiales bacterium]|tara:strand:+ start:36772 stop:37914 length:1143 start_codon:yes stop_codon:yes gene_type:complete
MESFHRVVKNYSGVALDGLRVVRFTDGVIDRAESLANFVEVLRDADWLAIDTEADSLHSYPEKLCLIQVGIPGRIELVDPLCGVELAGFWGALAGRELLMHGADYDLRLLQGGHDFVPDQIFDTMLAARLVGREKFGLADLVQHYLGVTLEKGSQKANWARRPLTPQMEEYARNDVLHLDSLVEKLRDELREKGREEWHRQECRQLIVDNTNLPGPDEDRIWRIKGSNRLSPASLAVLRELWQWREKEAVRRSRPPFFVLSHDLMLKLSSVAAAGGDCRPLLPRKIPERRRLSILDAIGRGIDIPASDCPQPVKPPPRRNVTAKQKKRFGELQERRDRHAENLEIDPTIIASRATLMALALDEEEYSTYVLPWQRELLAI